MILFKKIVGGALQNIANAFEVFKFDAACFVVNDSIEILIAESKLDIEPVFCFVFLL